MDKDEERRKWRASNVVELGAVLAAIRRSAGESQEDAAREIGVHPPYLSKIERGKPAGQVLRIFRLLRHYGYEIALVPSERSDAD
jgi:transcriptional regulator with XRE-family HTH domain